MSYPFVRPDEFGLVQGPGEQGRIDYLRAREKARAIYDGAKAGFATSVSNPAPFHGEPMKLMEAEDRLATFIKSLPPGTRITIETPS